MKISVDAESYTEQQEIFTGEMIARIADTLEGQGISGSSLKELTGKIAFEIACMIDGVSEISYDGSAADPYLTFQKTDNEIIHLGGNSYSHELVYGILSAMFKENT